MRFEIQNRKPNTVATKLKLIVVPSYDFGIYNYNASVVVSYIERFAK
jgi:hypothetical protein